MFITIKDTEYELKFDLAFVRRLNEQQGLIFNQVNIGNAVEKTMPGVMSHDFAILADYVLCANEKLTRKLVDEYIEHLAVEDEEGKALDEFANKLTDAIKHGVMTRVPFNKVEKAVKQAEKTAEKKDKN